MEDKLVFATWRYIPWTRDRHRFPLRRDLMPPEKVPFSCQVNGSKKIIDGAHCMWQRFVTCVFLDQSISRPIFFTFQAFGAAPGGGTSNWTNGYEGVEVGCSYRVSGGDVHIRTVSTFIAWTLDTAQKQNVPMFNPTQRVSKDSPAVLLRR